MKDKKFLNIVHPFDVSYLNTLISRKCDLDWFDGTFPVKHKFKDGTPAICFTLEDIFSLLVLDTGWESLK